MEFHEFQALLREQAGEVASVIQNIWQNSKSDQARTKAIEIFLKYAYDKESRVSVQKFDNMPTEEIISALREELERQEKKLAEEISKNQLIM